MHSATSIIAFLTSDVFLTTIIVTVLSIIGLKLFPSEAIPLFRKSQAQNGTDKAIRAYRAYRELSLSEVSRMQKTYGRIGRAHKRLGYELGYPAKLRRLSETVDKNALVTSAIADAAGCDAGEALITHGATESDLRDVREALRHFVRDWSSEGEQERSSVLGPILEVLSVVPKEQRRPLRVLVPGSGLGRLAWEINKLGASIQTSPKSKRSVLKVNFVGFSVTADELSPYMNLAFRFLISPAHTYRKSQYTLYPFAYWFSHQRSKDSLFRSVSFPDELPRLSETFLHIEDDFLQLGPSNSYNYIVTQFFIDTSTNIISTLEQIHNLLKPGGTWINLGPLLWRGGAQAALELSLEEVLRLAEMVGFTMDVESRRTIDCEYTADSRAMMRWIYEAELWVAKKDA